MAKKIADSADVLVVGAGISGISTALEAAETGYKAVLIEKRPYIGGRVAQFNHYFPKMCPPSCGLEINIQRLKKNSNINLLTQAEVQSIEGKEGDYKVVVKITPPYINNECEKIDEYLGEINLERDNDFNYKLDKSKVIYKPYHNAYPHQYVLDKSACSEEDLKFLEANFGDMVDLSQEETLLELSVKSIVWAVGWEPYDANNLTHLEYSKHKEVITNVEMERLASPTGPTGGKIVIPGSGKEPKSVVFVQCAGSRDENHLEYCSTICCLASMKQARYIREQLPDTEIHIFYIDIRATGVYEELYLESKNDEKIHFHRGKVAKIFKEHGSDELTIEAEDTLAGELNQINTDMAVLATGMKPMTGHIAPMDKSLLDENGFVKASANQGQYGCGVCVRPKDVAGVVQESTGAAIKAIHTIRRAK